MNQLGGGDGVEDEAEDGCVVGLTEDGCVVGLTAALDDVGGLGLDDVGGLGGSCGVCVVG